MGRSAWIWILGLGVALAQGCDSSLGPTEAFLLPDPDPSLDPDDLHLGDHIVSTCSSPRESDLAPFRGDDAWMLVDLYFSIGENAPTDGPSASHVELVAEHGGEVVHRFHVPVVRAWLRGSAIPDLLRDSGPITIHEVIEPSRHDVSATVWFAEPLPYLDFRPLQELGARVKRLRHYGGLDVHGAGIDIPDRSIPVLRGWPEVEDVRTSGGALCVGPSTP